jgi:hypothetical protein
VLEAVVELNLVLEAVEVVVSGPAVPAHQAVELYLDQASAAQQVEVALVVLPHQH